MANIQFYEITSSTLKINQAADFFLKPAMYLFNGRKIEITDGRVTQEEPAFCPVRWKKTAAVIAAIALIPGLIIGGLLKAASFCFPEYRKNIAIVHDFYKAPFIFNLDKYIAQLNRAPEHTALNPNPSVHLVAKSDISSGQTNITLNQAYLALVIKNRAIQKKLENGTKEVWKNPEFIQEVTIFMHNAYEVMMIFFKELAQEGNNNPAEMATIIEKQYHTDNSQSPIFSYKFFYNSLTEMYHLARGYVHLQFRPEQNTYFYLWPTLTEQDQHPFFNPQTPQYAWRQLYNTFCAKFASYNLPAAKQGFDTRFAHWAQPDTHKVEDIYYFPDTRPT